MSQTAITLAFEQHLADLQMGGQSVVPDEFVLANIPGLDINAPIDRAVGLPAAGQIVHRQLVDQRGKLNANGVAYSIIMDTRIGNFTFNAMYLLHKASGMVAMVVHKESEDKLKNQGPDQPGNSVVKSMLMEYQGAAVATNTTVDASTWQIDFSARLLGLDRDMQQQAFDHYGNAAFIADSFSVSAGTGVNEFIVAAGHGYIAGLRAELEQPHSIVVASRPATIYADVYHAGTLLSDWHTHVHIRSSKTPLADYVDDAGHQHYVRPLAQLAANGSITDLRGRGGLWWHEQRPQAHTPTQVGLDKVNNWDWSHSYTDPTGGAAKYATGKAVADAYNALNSAKLNATSYTAADVLTKMLTVDGATSGLDADLLDGQHGGYYRDWVNLLNKPAQASRWPTYDEITDKPDLAAHLGMVGAVVGFPRSSPPSGWLKANGAAISRTSYAELFSFIGTTFGVGDGTTTFNLPDLRGEFLRGWDDGKGVDSGRALASSQASQNLSHTHGASSASAGAHTHPISGTAASAGAHVHNVKEGSSGPGGGDVNTLSSGDDYTRSIAYWSQTSSSGAHTHPISGTAASSGAHTHPITVAASGENEARPRNIALLYCIKY